MEDFDEHLLDVLEVHFLLEQLFEKLVCDGPVAPFSLPERRDLYKEADSVHYKQGLLVISVLSQRTENRKKHLLFWLALRTAPACNQLAVRR